MKANITFVIKCSIPFSSRRWILLPRTVYSPDLIRGSSLCYGVQTSLLPTWN